MDAFNFAFSLFAIILGLSLTKVLEGFARALKRRRAVHLGWLTPLLGIFVMVDLTSFWQYGWASRRFLTPQYGMLLVGLFMSGLYYLAASIVFPSEFGDRDDFDEHYLDHRRQVIGAIIICDIIEAAPIFTMRFQQIPGFVWIENALMFGSMLTCLATRSKRVNIAALALMIAVYIYAALMSFIQPAPL